MSTGFENTSEETMRALVNNLKSGAHNVLAMGDKALVSTNPKECPPAAAFQLNMTLLSMFEVEFNRRGFDFDGLVGEEFRAIMDAYMNGI